MTHVLYGGDEPSGREFLRELLAGLGGRFIVEPLPGSGEADCLVYWPAEGDLPPDLPPRVPLLLIADSPGRLDSGATDLAGVLPATVSPAQLEAAIEAAAAGLIVGDPRTTALSPRYDHAGDDDHEALTAREQEVLELLADGLTNQQVADRLGISEHTAKFHVGQVLAKLGATSRTDAVVIGIRRGLLPL